MKRSPTAISETITRRNGRSFYLASHILAAQERHRAYDVYALCRIMDDATDEAQATGGLTPGLAGDGAQLSAELLEALFDDTSIKGRPFSDNQSNLSAVCAILNHCLGTPKERDTLSEMETLLYLEHLKHELREAGIHRHHLQALLEGQQSDEHFRQPSNFREFYTYCYQVAGVVGLMMALVFQARRSDDVLKAAEHLGIAMQISNILRDVREDALERSRVYLPADLMHAHAVTPDQLLQSHNENSQRTDVILALAHAGLGYYLKATSGIPGIPHWRCRLCVRLMAALYGAILATILKAPAQVFERRVVVGTVQRLLIVARVLLGGDPLRAAGFEPRALAVSSSSLAQLAGPEATRIARP